MDYKNARVYQILNAADKDVYVGSTCQALSKRMAKHRSNVNDKTKPQSPLYTKMKEIGVEHFYIELIEEFPCENKEQLRQREGFYIRQIGTLNAYMAGRSLKEWREENKDRIIEHKKQYYENNKDKQKQYYEDNKDRISKNKKQYREANKEIINESDRQYREKNKDRINENQRQYREDNKEIINESNRQYREENKDKINENQKQYREDNKERISALRSVKIMCECGCPFSKNHRASHLRSNKHAARVKLQSQPQTE